MLGIPSGAVASLVMDGSSISSAITRDVLLAEAGHGGAGPAEDLAEAGQVQQKALVNTQAIISSCNSTLPETSARV